MEEGVAICTMPTVMHPRNTRIGTIHAQASSPTMGRDYQSHYRGFSAADLPERPYTALERTNTPLRTPTMASTQSFDPPKSSPLKGSKSYDSLGSGAMRRPPQRDLFGKASPDSNLESVAEDDGPNCHPLPSTSTRSVSSLSSSRDGLGIHRSPSRSEGLREQMSSLKGRISSLRERAKEDSLMRQSVQNLREPSPLNNATSNAPEFFYTSSPSYGAPVLDTKAGVGQPSQSNSPVTPKSVEKTWEPTQVMTGSRNAFAEQAERNEQQTNVGDAPAVHQKPEKRHQRRPSQQKELAYQPHQRTPSGTAIVQSSKHRYSHHQSNLVKDDLGLVRRHSDYDENRRDR